MEGAPKQYIPEEIENAKVDEIIKSFDKNKETLFSVFEWKGRQIKLTITQKPDIVSYVIDDNGVVSGGHYDEKPPLEEDKVRKIITQTVKGL